MLEIKEKYLKFQMDWHINCAVFLLPKDETVECILPNPTKKLEAIRQLWLSFCQTQSSLKCNHVMINLSSSIYGYLLDHVNSQTEIQPNSLESCTSMDADDVLFRFGGVVLCDVLHLRYKTIKTCNVSRREIISKEIELLHVINT